MPLSSKALDDLNCASPALARYTADTLLDGVWLRPSLSPRDRSVATLATLIARSHAVELSRHLNAALDNGVTPAEISEIITHLAFYSGWGSATAAAAVAKGIFAARGVTQDQLPTASPTLLPIDTASEAKRASTVQETVGPVFQGLVDYTGDLLFNDLWLRPDLAPRDRSLVTVSALIAAGQVAQVPFHLNRAMDNGLTQAQSAELLTHLAFYAGWPNVMSAVPVVKGVFESRA